MRTFDPSPVLLVSSITRTGGAAEERSCTAVRFGCAPVAFCVYITLCTTATVRRSPGDDFVDHAENRVWRWHPFRDGERADVDVGGEGADVLMLGMLRGLDAG